MGFLKGGVTFQRYKVGGPKPRQFDDVHLERLPAADGSEAGWAAGGHVLDLAFEQDKNVYTDHLLWDLRIQTDRLPPERLKAYYETDLKSLAAGNTSGQPSPRQRREAKQSARARLSSEAKDGRWKKWKCVPCAWDSVTNTCFFGGLSSSHAARFESLWGQTFTANLFNQEPQGGDLTLLTAATMAERINPAAANETLSNFWGWKEPEAYPAWCPGDSPGFLGNEFLLWLWFFYETRDDSLKLPDDTEATFYFSGGLQLEDPRGHSGRGTMNSGSAVKLPEAKAAVRSGKLPRKAALTVVRQHEQFSFLVQAESLSLSSVKLPSAKGESPREIELARLDRLRDLSQTLDLMYATFLGLRLSPDWAAELKGMEGWLTASASGRGKRKAA